MKLIFLICLFSTIYQLNCLFIPASDNNIYTIGRSYLTEQKEIGYNWPCFSINFRVQGSGEIKLFLKDNWNKYQMVVNGTPSIIFEASKQFTQYSVANISVSGLEDQTDISIVKSTENFYGPFGSKFPSIFQGIQLIGQGFTVAKNNFSKKRKIEIFSDSDSNGFGILAKGTNLTCATHMKQFQNCYYCWSYQIQKTLNAETHVEAWSGKGLTQNILNYGQPMPEDWTKVTTNSPNNSWDFPSSWQPDAVIVWLGANDRINIKQVNRTQFISSYVALFKQILDSYQKFAPKTPKLIAFGQQFENQCSWIKEAVGQFKQEYNQTYYLEIPAYLYSLKNDFGCLFHTNIQGQQKLVNFITPKLEKIIYQD